ncbi:MAG: hypothetical protein BWZ01_02964 [Deltaproteobacteria bacterium ADurb.BinA179]|nr:MAG: hypothetical protein BWZ01_02964 [Deltaproteobacteria bacterium ADurb.BinA179]
MGMRKGTRMSSTISTRSSPKIFPNSRMVSESGRARCPMTSTGNMIGAIHQTGPKNCLMYFAPWIFTPTIWVRRKTVSAMERLVLRLAVGE